MNSEWDSQARGWVATSDHVSGLATEDASLEVLVEKLQAMILELLEANNQTRSHSAIFFEIFTRRFEIARRAAL